MEFPKRYINSCIIQHLTSTQKLVAIFKNAAQEGYYVDLSVVETVLGLPEDSHVSPVSGESQWVAPHISYT